MPMLSMKCSREVPADLLKEFSTVVSETIGKPEKYVMVLAEKADMLMSGEAGEAACIEIKSIGGLSRDVNLELTVKISMLLEEQLGIAPDRVYLTFTSVERDHWGWNKATFA